MYKSIELTPQSIKQLGNDVANLKILWIQNDQLNIPDLSHRKNLMSPEEISIAMENILDNTKKLVLHLRTQDSLNIEDVISRMDSLLKCRVDEILLVTWDNYWEASLTTNKVLKRIGDTALARQIWVSADPYKDWGSFRKRTISKTKSRDKYIYSTNIWCKNFKWS